MLSTINFNFMKKVLFLSAIIAVALMGCKKQSKLDFEDITTTSNLSGYIYYNAGAHIEKGAFIQVSMPAADKELLVKVPYGAYSAGAEGYKIYNVKTNAEGKYAIDLPVGKLDCKGICIEVVPFMAPYSSIDSQNKLQEIDALYGDQISNLSLSLGVPTYVNVCTIDPDWSKMPEDQTRSQKVTIKGIVKAAYEKNTDNVITRDYKNLGDASVKLTIKKSGDSRTLVYNTTTDDNGDFVFDTELFNSWVLGTDDVSIFVEVAPLVCAFKHYYQERESSTEGWGEYTSQSNIQGYYSSATKYDNLDAGSLLVAKQLGEITMSTFTPEDITLVKGLGYEIDMDKSEGFRKYRSNNVMYWEEGPYFYY